MTQWTEYRGEDSKPNQNRKIELHGPNYVSGVYDSADLLNWDFFPLDGNIRWRYVE